MAGSRAKSHMSSAITHLCYLYNSDLQPDGIPLVSATPDCTTCARTGFRFEDLEGSAVQSAGLLRKLLVFVWQGLVHVSATLDPFLSMDGAY